MKYFLIPLLFPFISFCQKATTYKGQQNISSFLFACQRNDVLFSIQVLTNHNGYWQMGKDSLRYHIGRHPILELKKDSSNIENIFDDNDYLPLKGIGTSFIGEYVNEKGIKGVYFSGLIYDKELNTLRNDSKQRAERVIESFILEFLKDASDFINKKRYQSIAVHVMYVSRDFAKENSVYNKETEGVVFSIPLSFLAQFIDNKITDKTLIKQSSVYILTNDFKSYRKTAL
jgi:hypothetical protein